MMTVYQKAAPILIIPSEVQHRSSQVLAPDAQVGGLVAQADRVHESHRVGMSVGCGDKTPAAFPGEILAEVNRLPAAEGEHSVTFRRGGGLAIERFDLQVFHMKHGDGLHAESRLRQPPRHVHRGDNEAAEFLANAVEGAGAAA